MEDWACGPAVRNSQLLREKIDDHSTKVRLECVSCAAAMHAAAAHAATIWSAGPKDLTFTNSSGSDPTQEANQDRISSSSVWITRDANQGIFNAAAETFFTHGTSPAGGRNGRFPG